MTGQAWRRDNGARTSDYECDKSLSHCCHNHKSDSLWPLLFIVMPQRILQNAMQCEAMHFRTPQRKLEMCRMKMLMTDRGLKIHLAWHCISTVCLTHDDVVTIAPGDGNLERPQFRRIQIEFHNLLISWNHEMAMCGRDRRWSDVRQSQKWFWLWNLLCTTSSSIIFHSASSQPCVHVLCMCLRNALIDFVWSVCIVYCVASHQLWFSCLQWHLISTQLHCPEPEPE